MQLYTSRELDKIYTAVIKTSSINDTAGVDNDFVNGWFNFAPASTQPGTNEFVVEISQALDVGNNIVSLPAVAPLEALTGWSTSGAPSLVGKKVAIQSFNEDDNPPGLPLTDFVIKGEITAVNPTADQLTIKISTLNGIPESAALNEIKRYVIDLFNEQEKLFEFKYPRFSYRYKYEDGEYSTFAPFTQVAFVPGSFDFHPRKGYNLGMTNRLTKVKLLNIVTTSTPKDVISIDILFKDDSSPSVYVVDTIKPDDYINQLVQGSNIWYNMLNSSNCLLYTSPSPRD